MEDFEVVELLERMAEDNEKMEMSTQGEGHFGMENLIPDGAFSPEFKYYLCEISSPDFTI